MLILSNALTDIADEGCVKIAISLVKRIKKHKDTFVIAYDRESEVADEYLTVNKLLLNRKLILTVKKNKGEALYIPFPAKQISTAVRVFILSLFAGKNLMVILSMTTRIGFISKMLLKVSRAKLVVFSKDAYDVYSGIVGEKRVNYLKTGVDTNKFTPVTQKKADELKTKYGFDVDKKLILHVGHLKSGRNVSHLKKISSKHQVLLVTSTLTKNEQDIALKNELLECRHIHIIDTYIPNIEEIYQMADVYFFPVVQEGNCIDVPLSCLEAAACNKPVVTTDFGEMREFVGKRGFYFINSFEPETINQKIEEALRSKNPDARSAVLDYDWKFATETLANGSNV